MLEKDRKKTKAVFIGPLKFVGAAGISIGKKIAHANCI